MGLIVSSELSGLWSNLGSSLVSSLGSSLGFGCPMFSYPERKLLCDFDLCMSSGSRFPYMSIGDEAREEIPVRFDRLAVLFTRPIWRSLIC